MSGDGCFRIRRGAGKPGLLGEVFFPQANVAFVFYYFQDQLILFPNPGVNTGQFMAYRIVKECQSILIHREGADAFPP